MKHAYIKVIYAHQSATGHRVIYVSRNGDETDISEVVESAEITVSAGSLAKCTLKVPIVVTMTERVTE